MLTILPEALPCGMAASYDFDSVNIIPFTFLDIINYVRDFPKNADEYTKFIARYQILRKKVSNVEKMYLPDIYYVAYLMFGISINDQIDIQANYDCNHCGTTNKIKIKNTDLKYKKYQNVIFERTFTDGRELTFQLPRGFEIEKRIHKIVQLAQGANVPLSVAFLIMGTKDFEVKPVEVYRMITGATHEDAAILMELLEEFTDPIEPYESVCPTCGNTNYVDLYNILETDFFRIFILNSRATRIQSSPQPA